MHVVHPSLVAGMPVTARDERHNPLGTLTVVAATTTTITLGLGRVRCTLPAYALLSFDAEGLTLIAGHLSGAMTDAIRTMRRSLED